MEGVGTLNAVRAPRPLAPAPSAGAIRRLRRRALPLEAIIGVGLLALLIFAIAAGPLFWSVDPEAQDLVNRLAPPLGFGGTVAHPLGTDTLGRDTLARLMAGARISMPLAAVATLGAGAIGVGLGVVAGYRGGWIDRVVSWLADVQLAIPFVVFAIAVTAVFGNSLGNVLLTLIVTGWVGYARVMRLQTRALRNAEWMEAARAIGVPPLSVIGRHLVPNLAAPIAVLATQQAGGMILYESSLSFLGLGIGGETVTWGGMAAQGREAVFRAPWLAVIPGLAIAWAMLAFNVTGDWLATRGRRGH
jgi:peptide/nickel transport system permease protein